MASVVYGATFEDKGELGSIRNRNGVMTGQLDSVGDIIAEKNAVRFAAIRDAGRISAGHNALSSAEILSAEEITAGETVFDYGSGKRVIVDGQVTGPTLDQGANGNLLLADNIDVKDENGGFFALTPEADNMFPTYHGDWEELKDAAREDPDFLLGLRTYNPDIDEVQSYDELMALEDEYRQHLDSVSADDLHSLASIDAFSGLPDHDFGTLLSNIASSDSVEIANVGEIYEDLETSTRETLIQYLSTDDVTAGEAIYEIAKQRQYPANSAEVAQIEDVLANTGDLPEFDDILADSPYREALETAYNRFEDELRQLSALSEEVRGESLSLSTVKQVKNWEYQRRNGHGRDIDQDELENLLAKEIEDKLHAYTKDLMQRSEHDHVPDTYEDLTGKQLPKDTDNLSEDEQEVLRAIIEYDTNRDTGDILLRKGNDIYEQPANQNWLEKHDYTVEDIVADPTTFTVDADDLHTFLTEQAEHYQQIARTAEDAGKPVDYLEKQLPLPENESMYERIEKHVDDEELETYDGVVTALDVYRDHQQDAVRKAVENGQLPETVTARIATPRETVQMGNYFDTCLSIGDSNGWGALANAADINKQVVYLENENDNVIGRQLLAYNEDGDLSNFSPYTHRPGTDKYLQEYVQAYAEERGLNTTFQNKRVEPLVADEWYSDMI